MKSLEEELNERMPKLLPEELLKLVQAGHFRYDVETKAIYVLVEHAQGNLRAALDDVKTTLSKAFKDTQEKADAVRVAADELEKAVLLTTATQSSEAQARVAQIEQQLIDLKNELAKVIGDRLNERFRLLTEYLQARLPVAVAPSPAPTQTNFPDVLSLLQHNAELLERLQKSSAAAKPRTSFPALLLASVCGAAAAIAVIHFI